MLIILYRETHCLMWKTKKQKLLTHYQFWKAIALAWLTGKSCHELQGEGTKWKHDGSSASTITCSLSSRNSISKMACINDAALDLTMGALKGRLNKNYVHYPEPSTAKQPCCSLCRLVHPNWNVIFAKYTSASIALSPSTRLLPSGTGSLKCYRSSTKNECDQKHSRGQ